MNFLLFASSGSQERVKDTHRGSPRLQTLLGLLSPLKGAQRLTAAAMGSVCSAGDAPLQVEADICHIFSEAYREEGLKLQKLNAALAPPRLTDRDWASVMDRGPSQWKMKLPAEATLQVSAEEGPPKDPTQSGRKWSSVFGLPGVDHTSGAPKPAAAPPPGETKQDDPPPAADAAGATARAVPVGAAPGAPARAVRRTEQLCQVEVLQQGCCTVRFDTMKPLLERLAKEGPLLTDSKLTPLLPRAENKRSRRPLHAVLVPTKPLVLQSTLPLPQQAEVYCEVELLSFVPFASYVAIGVAPSPYPVHHLPGLLPGSCALLSTGQVFTGTRASAADGQVLMEGDVIGCLFCRKSGQILFFLNGEPVWRVSHPEIMLDEEAGALDELPCIEPLASGSEDSPEGLNKAPNRRRTSTGRGARPDMYVTIGVLGKGELEINFGGKGFTLSGEITRVSRGAIQSTAPIAARAFGNRLALFHVMLDQLKLFYSCFNPPMVHKAKGMVVLNISRAAEFNAELREAYGKDLTDVSEQAREINKRKLANFLRQNDPKRLQQVDRIFEDFNGDSWRLNEFLRKTYGCDMLNCSVRRKQSKFLFFSGVGQRKRLELHAVAEQALVKPLMVDSFLRERYKTGINVLLRNRLRQVYSLYSPESLKEVDQVANKYPLFDDAYLLNTKMLLRYGVDLESFSPLEAEGPESFRERIPGGSSRSPAGRGGGALDFLEPDPEPSDPPSLSLLKSRSFSTSRAAAGGGQQQQKRKARRLSSQLSLSVHEPSDTSRSYKKQQHKQQQQSLGKKMFSFRSRSRLSLQDEGSVASAAATEGLSFSEVPPGAPTKAAERGSGVATSKQQLGGPPAVEGPLAHEGFQERRETADGEATRGTDRREESPDSQTTATAAATAAATASAATAPAAAAAADSPTEAAAQGKETASAAEANAFEKRDSQAGAVAPASPPKAAAAAAEAAGEDERQDEQEDGEAQQAVQLLVHEVIRRSSAAALEQREQLTEALKQTTGHLPEAAGEPETQQQTQTDEALSAADTNQLEQGAPEPQEKEEALQQQEVQQGAEGEEQPQQEQQEQQQEEEETQQQGEKEASESQRGQEGSKDVQQEGKEAQQEEAGGPASQALEEERALKGAPRPSAAEQKTEEQESQQTQQQHTEQEKGAPSSSEGVAANPEPEEEDGGPPQLQQDRGGASGGHTDGPQAGEGASLPAAAEPEKAEATIGGPSCSADL
ncbi:hypothetical protein Esti_006254 [Eimeria stiedai]